MTLVNRARVWGLLCRSAHAGTVVENDALFRRGEPDIRSLLSRLEVCGLVTVTEAGAALTEAGRLQALRTLREGITPDVVQSDPAAWRDRAWQSMRIFGQFTASDIAGTCSAPSTRAVRRYCLDLERAGFLRSSLQGEKRYVVLRSQVETPLGGTSTTPGETDPDRPWRARAWRSVQRLGAAGGGVRSVEVAAAACVSQIRAHRLLEELTDAGCVVRVEREGGESGGWSWVYALAPLEAADLLKLSRRVVDRRTWRDVGYRALFRSRPQGYTVAELVEEIARRRARIAHSAVYRLVVALVRAGLAEEIGHRAGSVRGALVYRLRDGVPRSLPEDITLKYVAEAEVEADA